MYGGGREKKTKSSKPKKAAAAAAILAAAEDQLEPTHENDWPANKQKKGSKRDKYLKGAPGSDDDDDQGRGSALGSQRRGMGGVNLNSLAEIVFFQWEELLGSREVLKRRVDTIAAVHGWQGQISRRGFLGGIEPSALLDSIRAEMVALDPTSEALERADLLLGLQKTRAQLEALAEERDRLADDLAVTKEDCFETRGQLDLHNDELGKLRQAALEHDLAAGRLPSGGGGGAKSNGSQQPAVLASGGVTSLSSGDLTVFKWSLARDQRAEGRRVVEALEQLKLPDESAMGSRELACWRENKKTIVNSLKTLSSQIYSAHQRILYEIIQNADDCSFDEGVSPEVLLECSDEALVSFHNETGFQPKDLYAMCQVGESSKAAESGKIGRKGIGFKSVFQISDQPIVLSPPFQFCFDVAKYDVFGYIVPTWVESVDELVPQQHHGLLRRVFSSEGAASASGTLLVCPMAQRVHGLDLLRDLNFDGLALAFLKNLEKISFVSSLTSPSSPAEEPRGGSRTHAYLIERAAVFERGGADQEPVGLEASVLKDISVVSHRLYHCSIIEKVESNSRSSETRRHYRLHSYTCMRYRADSSAPPSSTGSAAGLATIISMAFPVAEDLSPQRSLQGELVFAYLPVTAAGFGFALNADFELVASRQDVSDVNSNHVLLGRVPALFTHAVLSDPALGEDAFVYYLPDLEAFQKDRSGGGRKWTSLARALHRETASWLMIPTEDSERVPRRLVVLRPPHLSQALVPNRLLKVISHGDLHFAHADAVNSMMLENCLESCPLNVVLDCIRVVLEREPEPESSKGVAAGGTKPEGEAVAKNKSKHKATPTVGGSSLNHAVMLDVWCFLAAEYAVRSKSMKKDESSLRLLVDVLIGGMSSTQASSPFRIFPVIGSSVLRLHSEYGTPLFLGLSPSLTDEGAPVARLAESIVPIINFEVLGEIEGLEDLLSFLQVSHATGEDLLEQLKVCFRFGLRMTADPQLWWDAFKYTVSLGYLHGLVDFIPGFAVALPVNDSKVVSSRDVTRLSVSLPCVLGLRRRSTSKYCMSMPPSAAASWGARIRWELAMVRALGVSFPKSEIERIPAGALAEELLSAMAEARNLGEAGTLETLHSLLTIYEHRMSALLPMLRAALSTSPLPEELLLDTRKKLQPFQSSCSPKYVAELLEWAKVASESSSFHSSKKFLDCSLEVLRLRLVSAPEVLVGEELENKKELVLYENSDSSVEGDETSVKLSYDSISFCDMATWNVLELLLDFHHSFLASTCPWLLYTMLTPALQNDSEADEFFDVNDSDTEKLNESVGVLNLPSSLKPLFAELSKGSFVSCGLESAKNVWPLISEAGGVWLGSNFVFLQRCIWGDGGRGAVEVFRVLQTIGCEKGSIVAVESKLTELLGGETPDSEALIASMGSCFLQGLGRKHPPLICPTPLEMLLKNVLPWVLERDGIIEDVQQTRARAVAEISDDVEHHLSDDALACYTAVLANPFSPGRRWEVPVPTTTLALRHIIFDRALNPLLAREAAKLVVMPDLEHGPEATAFVARHFHKDCLHPALEALFAPMALRQSVGLETPRNKIQRNFKLCLRLMVAEEVQGLSGGGGRIYSATGFNWNLLSELVSDALNDFSDANKWELLLIGSIFCAKLWHQMKTRGTPEDASRYQEMLAHVRRIIPFCETGPSGTRWSFLAQRNLAPQGEAAADDEAPPVLLLRTLFGFELWGNLDGLELQNRAPSLTNDVPTGTLFNCCPPSAVGNSALESFPDAFDPSSLLLIWEWFLLEVAGSVPPALLWVRMQEPIAAWVRPRIRAAEAALREAHPAESLQAALLESVLAHSQVHVLMAEMDAVDEARQAAAQRAQEARQAERDEARRRRREEQEARQAARQLERAEALAAEAAAAALAHGLAAAPLDDPRRGQRQQRDEEHRRQLARAELAQRAQASQEHAARVEQQFDSLRRELEAQARANPHAAATEHLAAMGLSNPIRRMFHDWADDASGGFTGGGGGGGGGGGAPRPRQHTGGQMMRESEVKGKLARFLAGMRALERQQAKQDGGGGGRGSTPPPLPPVLSEFVAWAGDFLSGKEPGGAGGSGRDGRNARRSAAATEQAAQVYLGRSVSAGTATAASTGGDGDDDDDCCSICLEGLGDAKVLAELGEPLRTVCGHRFHAVCFAQYLEASEQDPWCPLCRSGELAATFHGL